MEETSGQLLIDGYNFMWAMDWLNPVARLDFTRAKDLLVELMQAYGKRESHWQEIILVFDGHKSGFLYTKHEEIEGLKIVFTGKDKNADKWIMETVSREGFAGCVVSSDREITHHTLKTGNRVIMSKKFESMIMEKLKGEWALLSKLKTEARNFRKKNIRRR